MQSRKPTRNERRQAVRTACERLGVTIIPLEGGGFRLHGPDVDLRVTDLAMVESGELKPPPRGVERRRA